MLRGLQAYPEVPGICSCQDPSKEGQTVEYADHVRFGLSAELRSGPLGMSTESWGQVDALT